MFTNNETRGRAKKGEPSGLIPATSGYRLINVDYTKYLQHRLAFLYVLGYLPTVVDHIDGNRENNKWDNLREATNTDNARNSARSSNNTSGCTGVSRTKSGNWVVEIYQNSVKINCGTYTELAEAIEVRKAKEKELGYHANHDRA